jgi:putative Holliday junction resolvase
MRILSVDYGTKRIGLAICDELGLTVGGLATLVSQGVKRDAHRIGELAAKLGIQRIILGLPLNMSGNPGPAATRVMKLATRLRRVSPASVLTWDERLTTDEANRRLVERGITPDQQDSLRDQIAACIILEDYLLTQHRSNQ